jgi:parvulin-like peptidyl-prolyl isomerase
MPLLTSAEQLERYRRQQVELAKKIKEGEAKARAKQKQDDQRREMLAGRCILGQLADQPDSDISKAILALLGDFVIRPADRALFPALPVFKKADAAP